MQPPDRRSLCNINCLSILALLLSNQKGYRGQAPTAGADPPGQAPVTLRAGFAGKVPFESGR